MEPLDCVVRLEDDRCEIWAGDQFQTIDQGNAAAAAGLKPDQVQIHTLMAGGSFGRRANAVSDYIVEAVHVAKALDRGTPVKLVWTREDDIRGGRYRPMYYHTLTAGLDAQGQAGRVAAPHRRPVDHRRNAVRARHGQGRGGRNVGRGCGQSAL